ncbi:Gem-like protein 4 [Quillaja saponaria]|uniref:Gem-like protein 4 n=1 Tax=Quillaja saponaria TaxID=32244 RepID=A0AAD7VGX1_QUISA|nr:Gem-like protein 4 [Quillaja saponaria]
MTNRPMMKKVIEFKFFLFKSWSIHGCVQSNNGSLFLSVDKGEEKIEQKRTFGEKSLSFVYRMSEHVRLRSKLSEIVTSTLNFGAAFIVMGGRDNIFKNTFGLKDGEELLNASHCYKYTTAAPIPGALFISTEKVAFCSEDFDNKLLILTRNLKDVTLSRNAKDPSQKYIEIVTEDKSKYKFKGFLRYESAFRSLQKALKHKEKMALKNNEATDDQLRNAVVMEAIHEKESQSMDTNSASYETSEQGFDANGSIEYGHQTENVNEPTKKVS